MPFGIELFGRSNQSQQGAVPTGNQPAQHQTGKQQTELPANNNSQPNPPGNTGEPGTGAGGSADPTKGAAAGSSLDQFNDIFKIAVDDKGQPVVPVDPFADPLVTMDQKALQEHVSKINFAAGVSPELAQKALQGDMVSFMQVLNQVAQNSFSAAAMSTGNVVNSAVRKNNERFDTALPDRIRNVQISQAAPKHPALSHPNALPVLAALKRQVAESNPHLSPEKVAEHAENYIIAMSTDVNSHTPQSGNASKGAAAEPDYSIFFPT